jgi:LacI family transcriptional regulator
MIAIIKAGHWRRSMIVSAPAAPTALICTHERIAVGARLAAAELGLTIPTDLSVVSLVPPLTTIERPDRAMASRL